jgi:PAP2 superfamily
MFTGFILGFGATVFLTKLLMAVTGELCPFVASSEILAKANGARESFPSMHSSVAFFAYGYLSLATFAAYFCNLKHIKAHPICMNIAYKLPGTFVMVVVGAPLTGASAIDYSDIAAGAVIGLVAALIHSYHYVYTSPNDNDEELKD